MTEMFSKFTLQFTLIGAVGATLALSGCGSGRLKARQEQREKMVSSTGLYCEWVNGEKHTDFDVELNIQMAKRCDSTRPFTIMPYKNVSDQNGILYCCSVAGFESAGGSAAANGTAFLAPAPHRAAGPAARRVAPALPRVQPQYQPPAQLPSLAPAQTAAPTLTPVPAQSPATSPSVTPPVPADSAPALNDDIVEDK